MTASTADLPSRRRTGLGLPQESLRQRFATSLHAVRSRLSRPRLRASDGASFPEASNAQEDASTSVLSAGTNILLPVVPVFT